MKYTYDVAAAGQSGGMTYECTEFKTSSVTLPAYSTETPPPETIPTEQPPTATGDNNGNAQPSGSLTLDALKQAAKNDGFVTDDSMSYEMNWDETTPKPVQGFCIEITEADGSKTFAINVNEFATAKDAEEYADYVNDSGSVGAIHTCGAFSAQFVGKDAAKMEEKLMTAFAAAGWVDGSEGATSGLNENNGSAANASGNTATSVPNAGDLIGVWEATLNTGAVLTYEFLNDGVIKVQSPMGAAEGTYKLDGDKLTTSVGGIQETSTVKLNGNTLTITSEGGATNTLTKK